MLYYNSFKSQLKNIFTFPVKKLPVHLNFSCPNRDGTKATEGCVYCNNDSLIQDLNKPKLNLSQQITAGIKQGTKFIVYFQTYTNTYTSAETLKKLFAEALSFKEVIGLAVGTRPDCLSDKILNLLAEINKKTYLWVEIGLQSANNKTLKKINRQHTAEEFAVAVKKCADLNLQICAHIIIGLPDETNKDFLNTAKFISGLPIKGIKLHNLHVLKNTVLEKMYLQNKVKVLSQNEYIENVVDFLEYIPSPIIVHRLVGDAPLKYLIAPSWCLKKAEILQEINNEFKKRNSLQGKNLLNI